MAVVAFAFARQLLQRTKIRVGPRRASLPRAPTNIASFARSSTSRTRKDPFPVTEMRGDGGGGAPSFPSPEIVESVPLSVLFSSLERNDGSIRSAFLDACACVFALRSIVGEDDDDGTKTKTTTSWKRVDYPESAALRERILSRLTESGCDHVGMLPPRKRPLLRPQDVLWAAVPVVYLGMVYRLLRNLNPNDDSRNDVARTRDDTALVTFADVAGCDDAARELREVVHSLRGSATNVGLRPPRGVLLYGPPGSGKTLMARAVAGEAGRPFLAASGGDFVETYVGRGAARVRELFARARREAVGERSGVGFNLWRSLVATSKENETGTPASALVFIDEIDALAKRRSGGHDLMGNSNDEREQTLNQLLTEMDGFHSRNEQRVVVIVLAATNRPDVLDPALLRPGRFDRHVRVGLPDDEGREAVLKLHARTVLGEEIANELDYRDLSRRATGCSGADLANVVREATFLAARDDGDNDTAGAPKLTQKHLVDAVAKVQLMKRTTGGYGNRDMR